MAESATKGIGLQEALELAIQSHQRGNFSEAETIYRKILAINPAVTDAQHNLSVLLFQLNRIDEAIPLLLQLVESRPDVEQYWISCIEVAHAAQRNELGKLLEQAAQYATQMPSLQEVISKLREIDVKEINVGTSIRKISQGEQKAYLNQLTATYKAAQYSKLVTQATKIKHLMLNDPVFWQMLGTSLAQLGKHEEALEEMRESIEHCPGNSFLWGNYGTLLQQTGQAQDAIKVKGVRVI